MDTLCPFEFKSETWKSTDRLERSVELKNDLFGAIVGLWVEIEK